MKWCVVIPTYNNEKTLEKVIRDVLAVTGNLIVVNRERVFRCQMPVIEYSNSLSLVVISDNKWLLNRHHQGSGSSGLISTAISC